MCLQCDVTKKNREDFNVAPREGAYVHGLYMEGARWDVQVSHSEVLGICLMFLLGEECRGKCEVGRQKLEGDKHSV